MRFKLIVIIGITICFFSNCKVSQMSKVDFLVGTWKVENKEQYEVWEKARSNQLTGYSYKMNENQKVILETLSIKKIGNKIIYEATVPDQNEGRTVPFTLNETDKYLSFENENHDFPKRIQYHRLTDDEIHVNVLGNEGQGFSFKITRKP